MHQAIWRGSNVGKFHMWSRKKRTAYATFCSTKLALCGALDLAKEVLYNPGCQWSQ